MSSHDQTRHFLALTDWPKDKLAVVLELAAAVKKDPKAYAEALRGKTLAMIFNKSSTRTRVSFEAGMFQLGGHAIFMSSGVTQVGRGEPLEDTARVLSGYVDGIMIRTFAQADVETLANYSRVPVINGLTDFLHPCQVLSDIFTVMEHFRISVDEMKGLPVAYVGDGNNMANSWINAAAAFGFQLKLACPAGFAPEADILASAGAQVELFQEPAQAAAGARVLNTDVWASMGQEDEAVERRRLFQGYQINQELLSHADQGAMVLHCLPAHRGEEITARVFDDHAGEIFTQAENRLHVQKALMLTLMADAGT